ncbi:hypothetical protein [Kistimonas scapharcae]|uniref:hypothetical protein n=1 Tax=Kistimonas scapharcae TaxID=1036133 RepID=UPI0031E6AA28
MDLMALLSGLSPVGWFFVIAGIIGWIALCYWMGEFSEKRWGDRESGALLGFFAPGLFLLVFWLIR